MILYTPNIKIPLLVTRTFTIVTVHKNNYNRKKIFVNKRDSHVKSL